MQQDDTEPAQRSAVPSADATSAPDDIDMDDGTATEAGDMLVRRGGPNGHQNLWAPLCIRRCRIQSQASSALQVLFAAGNQQPTRYAMFQS